MTNNGRLVDTQAEAAGDFRLRHESSAAGSPMQFHTSASFDLIPCRGKSKPPGCAGVGTDFEAGKCRLPQGLAVGTNLACRHWRGLCRELRPTPRECRWMQLLEARDVSCQRVTGVAHSWQCEDRQDPALGFVTCPVPSDWANSQIGPNRIVLYRCLIVLKASP